MKLEPMKPAPPVTNIFIARFPCSRRGQWTLRWRFCGASFRYEIVGAQEGFERASVSPPAVEKLVGEIGFFEVKVVDVGDFKFTTARRFKAANFLEYRSVVQVNPDDGVIRFGIARLFFDAH